MYKNKSFTHGVTLVELAIVLVIIGLLVVGVLAGQMLIEQAKIHKIIGELEDFNRAWNVFYLKYKGLPGDLKNPKRFFPPCNGRDEWGSADMDVGTGNGMIAYSPVASMKETNEAFCSWPELAVSGLYNPIGPPKNWLQADFPATDYAAGEAGESSLWPIDMQSSVKIEYLSSNSGSGIFGGDNYYILDNITATNGRGPILTPQEMYSIDSKMDDGTPTGNIVARGYNGDGSDIYSGPVCFNNSNPDVPVFPTFASEYALSITDKACAGFYYRMH